MTIRKEYGDFQTPVNLANDVISLITARFGVPGAVVEPTCGLGNFLEPAHNAWGNDIAYHGYEINPDYCDSAKRRFKDVGSIKIEQRDFFSTEWQKLLGQPIDRFTLVVGNPPWVTSATLGSLDSSNLPEKSNFQGLRGFDAKTGKANFDIAEWMIIRLVEALPAGGVLAFLCKTATARRALVYFWQEEITVSDESLYRFDSKKFFDVSVDACLLILRKTVKPATYASVYDSMHDPVPVSRFGMQNGELIANLDDYQLYRDLDGLSNYKWRSGVKHDAAQVMELTPCKGGYTNGMGEFVQIEDDFVYPLLKSSDVGNARLIPRKSVIITQSTVGEDTSRVRTLAPRTWAYLEAHAGFLDFRKSSIYRKRPRFSIFGIGEYSFAPWKVAISGLYKELRFVVMAPFGDKPTMVDDTCYFFPCADEEEARFWAGLLNKEDCIRFLHSLVFFDAKRPVNVDVLRRVDFAELARRHGVFEQALQYLRSAGALEGRKQQMLVFEEKEEYRKKDNR
ncbi:MAG: SAM-dependent DNA methyltransferase [Geobacter sp.]|nr:SAM-dependent DNA methyltransferase [Geobacter sp.]